ncbi:5-hydroxytryptamine receptor-like [Panonychus citri]|uniref:5-hydroxytryptamine receptor-like n=1 Tax=Panonychus citri TaxID=50023 RepID=UPI0023071B10|nr:5-hydroxytryptamine receptor-like [Panonychus citri]
MPVVTNYSNDISSTLTTSDDFNSTSSSSMLSSFSSSSPPTSLLTLPSPSSSSTIIVSEKSFLVLTNYHNESQLDQISNGLSSSSSSSITTPTTLLTSTISSFYNNNTSSILSSSSSSSTDDYLSTSNYNNWTTVTTLINDFYNSTSNFSESVNDFSSTSSSSSSSSASFASSSSDSDSSEFFSFTSTTSSFFTFLHTHRSLIFTLLTSIILGALILSTIIGNLFVIVAIWIDRNLQNIQNYLVASLAAADFMVACLVMPLGALYEVQGQWSLGSVLCDIWTVADVLCCTASILHLVAIALDRYWAVNSVTYMHSRSPTKICSIIISVWSVALIVSIGPILGWKDPEYEKRVSIEKRCLISQHMGYQIFATISTFYGPLMVILFLYWRIYKIARRRVKNRPGNKSVVHVKADDSLRSTLNGKPLALVETEYQQRTNGGGNNNNLGSTIKPIIIEESRYSRSDENDDSSLERGCGGGGSGISVGIGGDNSDSSSFNMLAQVPNCDNNNSNNNNNNNNKGKGDKIMSPASTTNLGSDKAIRLRSKKDSSNSKREGKTAKILAIITGIFIVCWLPFFVNALVSALCGESCGVGPPLYSIFLWLGYVNSLLNPVIYTIFSRDFRNAFRRILFGANTNRM